MSIFKTYGGKHLGLSRYIPYPFRAMKLNLALNPFGFWMPRFRKTGMTEDAKKCGGCIWYARFAWFELSYSRWV